MQPDTLLAQAGNHSDPRTGALSAPIYQSATFSHPALGESTGYDYSRTSNPTRAALESTLAALDGGNRACAFSSGMAALDAVFRLIQDGPRKRVIITEDPYGGTVRLVEKFFRPAGLEPVYVDTSSIKAVEAALLQGNVAMILVEIPSNPLLRVADIRSLASLAHRSGALLAVDNTFLTPYLFRPFDHGADLIVYSATKYLSGHNDVVAGAVICRTEEWGARLAYMQNAVGAVLGPFDCWLLLRGLKTLGIRLERQQDNALGIARFLASHPQVCHVRYPGLADDPGHALLKRQAKGFGAMISFETDDPERIPDILKKVRVFSFAESLGGVESLITYPLVQTHADIPGDVRERLGINERLLRLSVGIEHVDDLIADLKHAMT
ncbi:PLP-dependent aspartate aminotransferase family protein [Oxalobacter vibrioformis]|uniref:PLP-dependent aspartate aminotransferase family protein n=1 Tax=Oxalobacter vibrioformis TaxID=933080 RepID=A0A9E9LUU1_9BURK|nr:PLP-dependent aspartate aminotransferase family protein [Oxalobacter vibrioformis]WAW10070.1 PLP-dependent aspartate aminotransferase family protein [Oxalobacter vibrioformis]